jgi:predicted nucleotidyltransferase
MRMVALNDIRAFGQEVGQRFAVHQVILFGSYAQGTSNQDSDVDILVITPHEGNSVDTSVAIRLQIRPPFPLDLIVRSRLKIEERIAAGDTFLQDIIENGILLYEASDH